jgi:dihydrofolate synthase/folylpolyglutamate synthase
VVDAMAAAITAIDFDHEEYLGHTLEAIAGEKAAVIKPGAVAVLGANPPSVDGVVRQRCDAVGARLIRAVDGTTVTDEMRDGVIRLRLDTPRGHYDAQLALRGRHQVRNATTAVRLLEELTASGLVSVPSAAIRTALDDVVWPGRLEPAVWHGHDVLVDGAHNPAGARALQSYLAEAFGRPLPIVVGIMRDKPVEAILAALAPSASHFLCTAPATSRAAAPSDLVAAAVRVAPAVPAVAAASPTDALARAVAIGSPAVVAGSLYLAGEIRAQWA